MPPFGQRNLLLYSVTTTMQDTAEKGGEAISKFLMQLKVGSRVDTDESIHCIPLIPLPLISTYQMFVQWSHIDLFITKFIKTFPLFFAISVRDGCCRASWSSPGSQCLLLFSFLFCLRFGSLMQTEKSFSVSFSALY